MKPNVLEVNVDDKGFGGVFSFVMNALKNIDKNKFQIDICAFEDFENQQHLDQIDKLGSRVYLCASKGNFLLKQFRTCIKYYDVLKKNVYHTVHIHSDVAYKLLLYALVAKCAGVESILVHSHSSGVEGRYKKLKLFLQFVTRPILSHLQVTKLACSQRASEWMYLPSVSKSKDTLIINNGIDLQKFKYDSKKYTIVRNKLGIKPEEILIGTVARFSYQKYPEKLLAIFEAAIKQNPNFRLLWIGSGDLEVEIKDRAKRDGVYDKIIFYGNSNQVNDLYQAMDIFVLTSRFEGLCIAAVEAQAAGIPGLYSDRLSGETKLIANYNVLSIDEPDDRWADSLMKLIGVPKYDSTKELMDRGFDMQTLVRELTLLYTES